MRMTFLRNADLIAFHSTPVLWHSIVLVFILGINSLVGAQTNVPGAKSFLARHPESDSNDDGILTASEKRTFSEKLAIDQLGGDYVYHQTMVPMRDGVKLATGIFLPSNAITEKSQHPTVLCRSAYSIWSAATFDTQKLANKNLIYICQDLRGDGESEGEGTANLLSFDNEINDSYDTIEWISKQTWSNGKVAMTGQSGHGFAAYMGYLCKHPNLIACDTNISGGNAHLYWTFHNGVKREMYYRWMAQRNVPIPLWPKPGIELHDRDQYQQIVSKSIQGNPTVFIAKTGWYDIFSESAIDYFRDFADQGKVYVLISPSGHGAMKGRPFPYKPVPPEWALPEMTHVLRGQHKNSSPPSFLVYYLMGDVTDPNAPGNCYRKTSVWPIPHVPTQYYLKPNGGLETSKPPAKQASLSFQYDPRNPVPSEGGDVFIHQGVGPKDQRVLAGRKDILRFVSEPLSEPLEVTGKIFADLYISSSVKDTTFTAKLIDVYPDGYEAIVRDSIVMGRFHDGFDKQTPLVPGQVYHLKMDMWSTSLVFNKGHRIAVHISSSNSPKYEVHPNSFGPVNSFENAPIATNTIHLSSQHPTSITLPVVTQPSFSATNQSKAENKQP